MKDVIIKKEAIIFMVLILLSSISFAQEEEVEVEKKHTIFVAIGHTQVVKGVKDGNRIWLALPSWAIDYSYKIGQRWSLSLQNEIILSDFEVESNYADGQTIERTDPFSSLIIIGYKPLKNILFFAGGGAEFAKEENLAVIRLGLEPTFEINEKFELLLSAAYDIKIEGYDSISLSFGVGYKF